jgi:hypothetical protein
MFDAFGQSALRGQIEHPKELLIVSLFVGSAD